MIILSPVDYDVSAEAKQTAEFIVFVDQLFDSVNGKSIFNKQGRNLRLQLN